MISKEQFQKELQIIIKNALREDIGDGDHSSLACIPANAQGKAKLLVKENGIIAGVEFAKMIFAVVDKNLQIETFINDGNEVLGAITNTSALVLDARSKERFEGTVKEPRKGLRSGHISTSINIPYSTLLQENKMISPNELLEVFSSVKKQNSKLIFTCGSGITACILALGAEIIGLSSKSVYDGSWTEWGSLNDLPIE